MIVTLPEIWLWSAVCNFLSDAKSFFNPDRPIVAYIKEHGNHDGLYIEIDRDYKRADNSLNHRVYCNGSMQTCSAETIAQCAPHLHDIDAVNCGPTIYNQILKNAGIRCDKLDYYVRNREDFIEQTGLPRGLVKKAVTSLIHGGDVRHTKNPMLIELKDALRKRTYELAKQHERLWIRCDKNVGKFVSAVVSEQEARVVNTFFQGLTVRCNKFDGCLIDEHLSEAEINKRASDTQRVTGMPVKFKEKPLKTTDQPDIHWEGRLVFVPLHLFPLSIEGYTVCYYTDKARDEVYIPDDTTVLTKEHMYRAPWSLRQQGILRMFPMAHFKDRLRNVMVVVSPLFVHEEFHKRALPMERSMTEPDYDWKGTLDRWWAEGYLHPLPRETADSKFNPEVLQETHDDVWVQSIEPQRKVYVIRAGMGMGKTTKTVEYVRAYEEKFRAVHGYEPRILMLSARCSLSAKQRDDFPDFLHYTTGIDTNKLIIQYQSLHRLDGSEPFDLVVADELRELVACMASAETNKGLALTQNFELFVRFVHEAKQVIVLCADLKIDGACPNLLQSIMPYEDIELHEYSHIKMPRNVKRVSFEQAKQFVLDARRRNETTAIPCKTKANAEAWHATVCEFYPTGNAYVTGDCEDKGRFANMNDALKDVKNFAFSSTLSVGLDCTLPWDNVVIDARGKGGATVRQLFQMSGRFRNLSNLEVLVIHDDHKPNYKNTFRDANDEQNRRVERYKDSVAYISQDPAYQANHIKTAQGPLSLMFTFDAAERERDPIVELERQARVKGYTYVEDIQDLPADTAFAEHKRALKAEKAEAFEEVLKETVEYTEGELEGICENAYRCSRAGVATKTQMSQSKIAKTILEWKTRDIDTIKTIIDKGTQLYNIASAIIMAEYDEVYMRRQLQKMANRPGIELTNAKLPSEILLANELVQLITDNGTNTDAITPETFKRPDVVAVAQKLKLGKYKDAFKPVKEILDSYFNTKLVGSKKRRRVDDAMLKDTTYTLTADETLHALARTSPHLNDLEVFPFKEPKVMRGVISVADVTMSVAQL